MTTRFAFVCTAGAIFGLARVAALSSRSHLRELHAVSDHVASSLDSAEALVVNISVHDGAKEASTGALDERGVDETGFTDAQLEILSAGGQNVDSVIASSSTAETGTANGTGLDPEASSEVAYAAGAAAAADALKGLYAADADSVSTTPLVAAANPLLDAIRDERRWWALDVVTFLYVLLFIPYYFAQFGSAGFKASAPGKAFRASFPALDVAPMLSALLLVVAMRADMISDAAGVASMYARSSLLSLRAHHSHRSEGFALMRPPDFGARARDVGIVETVSAAAFCVSVLVALRYEWITARLVESTQSFKAQREAEASRGSLQVLYRGVVIVLYICVAILLLSFVGPLSGGGLGFLLPLLLCAAFFAVHLLLHVLTQYRAAYGVAALRLGVLGVAHAPVVAVLLLAQEALTLNGDLPGDDSRLALRIASCGAAGSVVALGAMGVLLPCFLSAELEDVDGLVLSEQTLYRATVLRWLLLALLYACGGFLVWTMAALLPVWLFLITAFHFVAHVLAWLYMTADLLQGQAEPRPPSYVQALRACAKLASQLSVYCLAFWLFSP
eukprot:TRINITY_DN15394_c0_g1_i1.p1 TRINITY_DN15394_c0_g1~~TRINITY_DN15394_c0_g1_i1.p1  ORF type:complete len:560 (+),score=110.66 TRINITY_DN15394_c0_g1_i1:83-1762(+)